MNNMALLKVMDYSQEAGEPLACAVDVTTENYAKAQQFEMFRAAHAGVLDVSLVKSCDSSFPARQMAWDLGKFLFVFNKLPGKGYIHRWEHLRRGTLDHWYLALPVRASRRGAWQDQRANVPSLHCLAAPFEGEAEDDGMIWLFMPRDLFSATSALDHMLNIRLDNGLGLLLADYMLLLNRSLPQMRTSELPYIVEATRSLICACIASSQDRVAEAHGNGVQGSLDMVLIERTRRLVNRRLSEPGLTPALICKELGTSRSRLYRLFEPFGGISAYIRRQRLLRTRDALLDSADRRPVARIAEQWGFVDASGYSRAFKQEFGISPKEAREIGWGSNGYVFQPDHHRSFEQGQSLGHLLRRLGA